MAPLPRTWPCSEVFVHLFVLELPEGIAVTFCAVLLCVVGVTVSAVLPRLQWQHALVAEHVTVHPYADFVVNYLLFLINRFWGDL